jgi:hypothetical protein
LHLKLTKLQLSVHCAKSPFTLFVIPGLTKPAPYLIRGGNDTA